MAQWVHDHEAVNTWLRAIPAPDRPAFLGRIAGNIEAIQKARPTDLQPTGAWCRDAVLSYAILVEYADHLGVSPVEACWTFECESAEGVDALLGARVDRMLADAAERRARPRRRGEDSASPAPVTATNSTRVTRGLRDHWKVSGGRRGKERRADDRGIPGWTATEPLAFHAGEPGRAG